MLFAAAEDRNGCADTRELYGDRLAEAGSTAGHDHDLAVEGAEGERVRADFGGSGEAHAAVLLWEAWRRESGVGSGRAA